MIRFGQTVNTYIEKLSIKHDELLDLRRQMLQRIVNLSLNSVISTIGELINSMVENEEFCIVILPVK